MPPKVGRWSSVRQGGFLLPPDAAALGIGQADAIYTLLADLDGGHALRFAADLFLHFFAVQPIHDVEDLVRFGGDGAGIIPGLGAGLSEHIRHADFFIFSLLCPLLSIFSRAQ